MGKCPSGPALFHRSFSGTQAMQNFNVEQSLHFV